ncbi:hypothetical protein Daus18300_013558 [Diaporthe australafricana]|uniref:Uncharacterized protein n=1 Tax=Diaporthe australafricana TaxID=127596 RepID=A0ABR3VYK1_9PEZI
MSSPLSAYAKSMPSSAGGAAALRHLFTQLGSRTFENLLPDMVREFLGAASQPFVRIAAEDGFLVGLQERIVGFAPNWMRRLVNPPPEGDPEASDGDGSAGGERAANDNQGSE